MSRGTNREDAASGWTARGLLITLTSFFCLAFAPSALAAPPVILQTSALSVSTESATLRTAINPEGKATSFFFEYGTAPCSEVPNPCTQAPKGTIPLGTSPVEKTQAIEGLSPATTYFFRVIAKNADAPAGVTGPDRTFTTLFLPSPFGPCPNDALRAGPTGKGPGLGLPDCRAYEQASPLDKNGTSLLGEQPPLRASLTGDAIVFESSSGIPGGEGAQNFPYYQATRGAGDWSTQGILPHGSAGDAAKVTGWSRDLSSSYSMAEISSTKEKTYLARSAKDGTLQTIVDYVNLGKVKETPLVPGTFFFAGAASNGSTAYFEATGPNQAELSPDAAPNRNNLYAWERDTEELALAGVLPDGSTPPGGSLSGPYDWVRGTNKGTLASGGSQDGYYTQDTHAVSEDGERAFFTAGDTGQLYLRENATDPSASTQQVSKSQRTPPDPLGARPAAFQAATPDGSHAFFTSSEKLTDDATTGPEVTAIPAIARAEKDKDPIEIKCLPTSADWVDVSDEFVYWTDSEEGTIGRADLGCEPASIDPDFIVLPEIEVETETGDPRPNSPQSSGPRRQRHPHLLDQRDERSQRHGHDRAGRDRRR